MDVSQLSVRITALVCTPTKLCLKITVQWYSTMLPLLLRTKQAWAVPEKTSSLMLITSFSIILLIFLSILKTSISHVLLSSLRANRCYFCAMPCSTLAWSYPWTTCWELNLGLQLSPVSLKAKSLWFYSFLVLCWYFCPWWDGAPQSCSDSYFPYSTCRNVGMNAECLALTLTDLTLLPGRCPNVTKMNHMGSPSSWGH